MNSALLFFRLTGMRRRAGGSRTTSLRWAAGLLWRGLQSSTPRKQR